MSTECRAATLGCVALKSIASKQQMFGDAAEDNHVIDDFTSPASADSATDHAKTSMLQLQAKR